MANHFDRLPDELFSRVFSRLEYHKLGHCAVVSTRWRSLTSSVDELRIDCSHLLLSSKDAAPSERVTMLEGVITRAISDNAGNGVTTLAITGPNFTSGALLRWLTQLQATLQVLVLENECNGRGWKEFLVGDHFREIFNCRALQSIELTNWLFSGSTFGKFAGRVKPLLNLVSCKFRSVVINDQDLETFLSLCPALTTLDVEVRDDLATPTITSNVLEKLILEFTNWDYDEQFYLKNLTVNSTSLKFISLTSVKRLAGDLPGVKDIRLNSACKIRARMEHEIDSLVLCYCPTSSWGMKSILTTLGSTAHLTIGSISVLPRMSRVPKGGETSTLLKYVGGCETLEVGGDLFQIISRDLGLGAAEDAHCPLIKRLLLYMSEGFDMEGLRRIATKCPSLERVQCFTKMEPRASPPIFEHLQNLQGVLISCHNLP